MPDFIRLQILPSSPAPLIALHSSGALVPDVPARPLPLPAVTPADPKALWAALPAEVGAALTHLASRSPAEPVTLWLDVQVPELAAWPWERLTPPGTNLPFACRPQTPLARAFPALQPQAAREPGPLRALVLCATPTGAEPIDVEPTLARLRSVAERHPAALQLAVATRVRAEGLPALREAHRPDLLLVLAHASPGALLLEDAHGEGRPVAAADLARLLQPPPVVALAACDGATFGPGGESLATALLRAGAPGVVAVSAGLAAATAGVLLDTLLDALAGGAPLEVAVARARQAILAALGTSPGDWMLPICYQRVPGRPLVALELCRGVRTLGARAANPALAIGGQLAAGGLLGLLGAFGLGPLLTSLLGTGAIPAAALSQVLGDLGLNVLAGALGGALQQVWGGPRAPDAPVAPGELRQAIRQLVEARADVAAELAELARASGALGEARALAEAGAPGGAALLEGIARDVAHHGAALADLDHFLRSELTGLRADVRHGVLAILDQGAAIRRELAELDRKLDGLRDGPERERRERIAAQRQAYLHWVVSRCQAIGRARLVDGGRDGRDGKPVELYLQDVYVALTTEKWWPLGAAGTASVQRARAAAEHVTRWRGADVERPARARRLEVRLAARGGDVAPGPRPAHGRFAASSDDWRDAAEVLDTLPDDTLLPVRLARPEPVIEAMAPRPQASRATPQTRLVLLGDPGSGKSTALRYAAVLLAQWWLGEPPQEPLPGWEAPRLPLLLPLGRLAAPLAGASDPAAVLRAELAELLRAESGGHAELAAALDDVLPEAILLLDGLDELSNEAGPDGVSTRLQAARAIRALARTLPATPIVVTCRVLPYEARDEESGREAWQFGESAWEHRTVQPFAFGQVRAFVRAWYEADQQLLGSYRAEEADRRAAALLAELDDRRLREAIRPPAFERDAGRDGPLPPASPLLLTMLAILHANRSGEPLPTERDALYEELVQLLLQRWEPRRSEPLHERRDQDLISRLNRLIAGRRLPAVQLKHLRATVHQLAYAAHCQAAGRRAGDGRGVLDAAMLEGRLLQLFERELRWDAAAAGQAKRIFLEALQEEAGLIQAPDTRVYTLPHLTFQEYLAACALVDLAPAEMARTLYAHWASDDADRWEEVIALLLGKPLESTFPGYWREWLDGLLRAHVPTDAGGREAKAPRQLGRDAELAARCFAELVRRGTITGGLRDDYGPRVRDALHRIVPPQRALTREDIHLPAATRARAALHLGGRPLDDTRGDTRPGVCALPANLEDDGYWADWLPAGAYLIGEHAFNPFADDARYQPTTVRLARFRVARYPVTAWQFRQFMDDPQGYEHEAHWPAQGWAWKKSGSETKQPWYWDDPDWTADNQPVVGVSWYEAMAFCSWLDARARQAGWLTDAWTICLPTEAQWEVAAQWDVAAGTMRRWESPADEPWQNCEETKIGCTCPVGLFPHGASPCGAFDMAGNAWEWCASADAGYPGQSATPGEDFAPYHIGPALRGGDYSFQNTRSGWGARFGYLPLYRAGYWSFRVCVCSAPPS